MVQINGWHRSRYYQHHATQSWIKYVLAILVCTWWYSISGINNQFQKIDLNVNSKRHPYQASSQQKCRPLRDVSQYSTSAVHYPIDNPSTGRQNSKYDSCLQFKCDWNSTTNTHCDSFGPTIYDDPSKPPCCVHILRDMAAAFDHTMCQLGFEYFSSYGMLLGLVRSDKLIPWTSDNDYIATERTLAAMYDMTPKDKKVWDEHGLAFFFDNYYHRVCVTDTFMDGQLAKLWTTSSYEWYPLVYPYADIFIAKEIIHDKSNSTEQDTLKDQLGCAHSMDYFRPAQRRGVYQNSFQVSMPSNPEKIIERVYGSSWRTPDREKKKHGDTKCRGD